MVHRKTKLALLQMLTQLSVSSAQYRLLRSHVTVFVWYSVPFMMSCERYQHDRKVVQIIEISSGAVEDDAAYRNSTASCTIDNSTSSTNSTSQKNKISYQDALHSWNTVISHPEIVDTYRITRKELVDDVWNKTRQQHLTTSSSGICGIDKTIQLTNVPFSDEILSSFHRDAGFMKRLGELSRAVDEM